jgi:O-antigen/teichoic acid export membrane protein
MGRTKLATGLGWVVAIPGVALVLYRQGTVTLAVSVWLLSLLGANLITILLSGRELHRFYPGWSGLSLSGFRTVVGEGFWFNASNTSWLVRTYGTTVLISALYGPATAGLFFILLRLSEVISALGAISSDLLLGGLAHASTIDERRDTFASAYSWAVLLCAHIALIVGFVAPEFCRLWLRPTAGMSPLAGFVIAGLGFGSAFNRIATYSAMALGLGRTAARWGFIEALTFVSLLFLAPASIFSLYGRLGLASVAAFTLWPIALGVSRELELPTTTAWLRPMWSVAPFLAASAAVLTLAWFSDHLAVKAAAIGISGVIGLINMFRRKPTRLNVSNGVIGSAAASQIPC